MANTTFQTRLKLKYDSYQNWSTKNPVLLKGEAAVVVVSADSSVVEQEPAVLLKIGDGTSQFNDLAFISAKSADIHDWAKAATKPTYAASEITGLEDYIQSKTEDTNTTYKLEISDHTLTLSKSDDGSQWSVQNTIAIPKFDDSELQEAIEGKQDKLEFNSTYNASTNKVATMKDVQDATAGLTGALHWRGKVDSKPSDGTGYSVGDVIAVGTIEYAWDGESWVELGNEASHHTHSNLEDLNKITDAKIKAWDDAANKIDTHTHKIDDLEQTAYIILDCGDATIS